MEIKMTSSQATNYVIDLPDGRIYSTHSYLNANRMQSLWLKDGPAAECVDCGAIILVTLVDELGGANRCPAAGRHYTGHRVSTADYDSATAWKVRNGR